MKKTVFLLFFILLYRPGQSQSTPELETFTLKNGLKVFFIKYGKIEAVHVSIVVNSGKKNEVPGQQGYNGITAQMVLKGNKKYSEEEQNDKAYAIGIEWGTSSDFDETTLSANFLSKDAYLGFDLMSAALLQPLFDKTKIEQDLSQIIDYNNPAKIDITKMARIYTNLSLYGLDNPLGRNIYKAQLKQITPEKIKEFYAFNYTPKNTTILVCGNFNSSVVKGLIESYFGAWQSAYGEVNGVELDLPVVKKREVFFVNKASATQCALQWTKMAPSVKDKDFLAFEIANLIFNDVLHKEIRENAGKTYSIRSVAGNSRFSNLNYIMCSVRNSEVMNTLDLFDKTLQHFSQANFSKNDFDVQITSFKTEILRMEYPEQVAAFYNPLIYDFITRKNALNEINNLKIEDVQKVIKKYFTPDVYKLVIAGDETAVSSQLGKINTMKKYGPADLELKN